MVTRYSSLRTQAVLRLEGRFEHVLAKPYTEIIKLLIVLLKNRLNDNKKEVKYKATSKWENRVKRFHFILMQKIEIHEVFFIRHICHECLKAPHMPQTSP